MMKIDLLDENGKKFTVKQRGVKTRGVRELIKFYSKMEKHENGEVELSELEIIDEMISLVTELFVDPRVTFDAIQDSIAFDDLMPTIEDIFANAMNNGEKSK